MHKEEGPRVGTGRRGPQRGPALPKPGSQTSSLQKWEERDSCCRPDRGPWLGLPDRMNTSLLSLRSLALTYVSLWSTNYECYLI